MRFTRGRVTASSPFLPIYTPSNLLIQVIERKRRYALRSIYISSIKRVANEEGRRGEGGEREIGNDGQSAEDRR